MSHSESQDIREMNAQCQSESKDLTLGKVKPFSKEDIPQMISDKEKDLRKAIDNLAIITQEYNKLRKEIHVLEGKKIDMFANKGKASLVKQQIESDLRLLKNEFWKPEA